MSESSEQNSPAESKDLIIVCEDSAPNRKILCHLLEKFGFEVKEFSNGKEAYDFITTEKPENLVAILSDIMMPEMDGLKLLQTIRKQNGYKELPFVLITAVSDKDYILHAKKHNANGYILKPVTFAKVTAKLQELFPNKNLPSPKVAS